MSSPDPRQGRGSPWAWLWRVTDHQVVGGLVVAVVLALIGLRFLAGGGGFSPAEPAAQPSARPAESVNRPATPPVLTTAPASTAPVALAPCPHRMESPTVSGPLPWTVEGFGFRYTVVSVTRTSSEWMSQTKPSITVVGCITHTKSSGLSSMKYLFSDVASGSTLDPVPLQGGGNPDPPLNRTSRLVSVLWDVTPAATRLAITLHDFFWPDTRDLTMLNVPVGRG
jgi:hypothetical protein